MLCCVVLCRVVLCCVVLCLFVLLIAPARNSSAVWIEVTKWDPCPVLDPRERASSLSPLGRVFAVGVLHPWP